MAVTGDAAVRPDAADRATAALDDHDDAAELRARYEALLGELRVVLPGVQVLLAFLLTAPFADRFAELDDVGVRAFAVATTSALVATVCLLTPAAVHRVGDRRRRRARLRLGVGLTVTGIGLLGLALCAASWCVARFLFDDTVATVLVAGVAVTMVALWWVLPRALGRADA